MTAHSLRVRLITLALLAVGLLTVLTAVPGLREVLHEIRHVGAPWVAGAVGLEVASCLSFVVIFRLFFDRLPARLSRQVAWTEMGSGALLPGGGAGSLAIGGWLLHASGMPAEQVVRRSSGLFFLTSAINVAALILGGLLLLAGISPSAHPLLLGAPPVLLGLIGAAGAITMPALMRRRGAWARQRWPLLAELVDGIGEAERALLRPSWRQAGAIGYLAFDIAVLWATLSAVGYSPPLATLILGYIIGYLANMIPVPGGIGVLEGGLAATLILYGAPPDRAAAGVLVYHAIAFWIPSIGGLWAYAQLRQSVHAASRSGLPALVDLPPARRVARRRGPVASAEPVQDHSQVAPAQLLRPGAVGNRDRGDHLEHQREVVHLHARPQRALRPSEQPAAGLVGTLGEREHLGSRGELPGEGEGQRAGVGVDHPLHVIGEDHPRNAVVGRS